MTQELLMNRKKEQGFTLVELAIVMIIIGLLIGGILKGQEMIENAKVTSTIAQIKSFQAALNSFRDTYSGLPGDMRNATTRVPNCTAATNCGNGNGDGLIGGNGLAINAKVMTGSVNGAGAAAALNANTETVQAWKHLVLANLISSVPADANTLAANLAFGVSHPTSSLRGGYEIFYDSNPGGAGNTMVGWQPISGHFLRMSNTGLVAGGTVGAAAGTGPVSPLRAAQIDRKIDDGRATSGSALAAGNGCLAVITAAGAIGAVNATAAAALNNDYNGVSEQNNCVMWFLIDG